MITRLIASFAVVLTLFLTTRMLVRSLPGDPIETLLAETGTAMPAEELRHELGLDRPFLQGAGEDLITFLQGDWGHSILTRQSIREMTLPHLKNTLLLSSLGFALGLSISLFLGFWSASPGSLPGSKAMDWFCSGYGALMAALPTPWLGPILIYFLAISIPAFPVSGHIFLPALTIALGISGFWSRLVRERIRLSLQNGAAPGARARGISEWKVILKYGLAPASGPLAAYFCTQFGLLLGGTFVVEIIFDWPGMGTLLIDAVFKRDYPVVEVSAFITAILSVGATWAGDVIQKWINPRLLPF